jgi:multicomponent Na+:H+ antiporter subunit D
VLIVVPLGILWVAAVAIVLLDGRQRWVGAVAITALAAALVALLWLTSDILREGPSGTIAGGWPVGVGIALRADALGVLFAVLSLGVLLIALTYEVLGGVRTRTFPALVLFLATGLTGVFLTGDAFNFYVFFEIAMISAYVLTGYGERSRQLRAAMIFAVVNLLGSVFFLISVAALYHITGTLDMHGIASRVRVVDENPAIITATLLFVAFSVKLGLFPFHFWLPAVYTGTRPAVAAILSGALANIGSYGLLRFGADILPREVALGAPALMLLGVMSVIYGALQAVSRHNAAEVLAYSAIGQVGYVMLALAIGGPVGYAAVVLYAVINALNKTLLFLAAGLRGWLVGAAFVVGALSVVGVPPAAGFIGKAALFRTGLAAGETVTAIAVVGFVFLGGALSFVYMLQIYQRRYRAPRGEPGPSSLLTRRLLVLALAVFIVALGVWPEPLLALSQYAAEVLPRRLP